MRGLHPAKRRDPDPRITGTPAATAAARARALSPKQVQVRNVRADEGQAGLCALPREVGTFGQESVAGMDGIASGTLRCGDHRFDVQVGGGALPRQHHHLIRHPQMQAL